jgi:hypothetical protein
LQSYKQGIKRQRLYKKAEIEALLTVRPSSEEPEEPPNKTDKTKEPKEQEEEEKSYIPPAEDWIPYF